MASPVPMERWPVQADVLTGLCEQIKQDAVPHAMLFVGSLPETTQLIHFLAQMLLCEGTPSPCGQCGSCRQFEAGTHPDYHVVNPGDGGSVKTGQVGDLQEHLMLRTHSGGKMVYVIHGIGDATPTAANRLLKTLEEPSKSIIALLSCENPRRVLPTILSRCFVYRLDVGEDSPPWDDAFNFQTNAKESQEFQTENSLFATFSAPMIQWIEALFFSSEPVLLLADQFSKTFDAVDLTDALKILVFCLRDAMHLSMKTDEYIRFKEHQAALAELGHRVSTQRLIQAIRIILDTRSRLQVHVVGTLNLEQMCIRLREVMHVV